MSRSEFSATISSVRTQLDLIAIGRVSVDLYGQQIGSRLEDVATFAKAVGGCPANVAIGQSAQQYILLRDDEDDLQSRFIEAVDGLFECGAGRKHGFAPTLSGSALVVIRHEIARSQAHLFD